MTSLDLSVLNEPQREAVEHTEGPLLVFAGAGSGKTRVLTYRLARLIHDGVARPWQILAVTFTNKAAGEMKKRVEAICGAEARDAWVQTFHSACLRILRRDGDRIGLERNFVIYDDRDQREVIRRVLKEVDPTRRLAPGMVRSRIEQAKRGGELTAIGSARLRGTLRDAYDAYERELRAANAVDFSDLISRCVELFDEHPDVEESYQQRFRYLLVDEFQDTDGQQYDLVRRLARPEDNLCVVGDDDQSIYSFRGADVGNIRGFGRDYPGAKVVKLEQNYRSTTAILDAAARVVNGGGGGVEAKRLWTDRGEGEAPRVREAQDEADEARKVAWRVRDEIGRGVSPSDIAVLYRTNAQSRSLEEAFDRADLPFLLVGGMRFYERREVKEALAYLRLLIQPRDLVSFERAVRAPARGIGDTTVTKIRSAATAGGLTAEEAMTAVLADGRVGKAIGGRLKAFGELIAGMRADVDGLPLPDALELVIERSGMEAAFREDGSHEALGRADNLQELVRSAVEHPGQGTGLDAIAEMLDRSSLRSDADDLGEGTGVEGQAPSERVHLMTIHCAKGLEFPVVCLVGLDEGIFPNSRAASTQSGVEEEYRLCYVAATRAQDRLYLFRSRRRMLMVQGDSQAYRRWQGTRPSPFLRWLVAPAEGGPVPAPSRLFGPAAAPADEGDDDDYVVVYEPEGEQPFRPGMRVRHPSFGTGEIRRVEGSGPDLKLTVFFRGAGMRRLVARFANLEILG